MLLFSSAALPVPADYRGLLWTTPPNHLLRQSNLKFNITISKKKECVDLSVSKLRIWDPSLLSFLFEVHIASRVELSIYLVIRKNFSYSFSLQCVTCLSMCWLVERFQVPTIIQFLSLMVSVLFFSLKTNSTQKRLALFFILIKWIYIYFSSILNI